MMSWDRYKLQKLDADFGNYVQLSCDALEQKGIVDYVILELAQSISRAVWLQGYTPAKEFKEAHRIFYKKAKVDDFFHEYDTLGAIFRVKLAAKPEQYVCYLYSFLSAQNSRIASLETFGGWAREQKRRLVTWWRRKLNKLEWYEKDED